MKWLLQMKDWEPGGILEEGGAKRARKEEMGW